MVVTDDVGVGEIHGEDRVVLADGGAQEQRPPPAEQQLEAGQEPRACVIEAVLAVLEGEDVPEQVENTKRVAVLQHTSRRPGAIAVGDDREVFFQADDVGHDAVCYATNPDLVAISLRKTSTYCDAIRRAVNRRSNVCAARAAVDRVDAPDGIDSILDGIDDEPGHAIIDDLADRPAGKCDDGQAAGHGFDHDQPERLGPVNREEQGFRLAEKRVLVPFGNLADELDERIVEQRGDGAFEVGLGRRGRLSRRS